MNTSNQLSGASKKKLVLNYSSIYEEANSGFLNTLESSKGSLTTNYGDKLDVQYEKINQKANMTEEQQEVVYNLVSNILNIESLCLVPFDIKLAEATDDEIVLSRKTDQGIAIISVNEFGDIMVNFSYYSSNSSTSFYRQEDYDSENVVFHFLSL